MSRSDAFVKLALQEAVVIGTTVAVNWVYNSTVRCLMLSYLEVRFFFLAC